MAERGSETGYLIREVAESVIVAVVLAFVIRFFLFQPFFIPSGSMEPTLKKGDRIVVNKITYRFSEPKRGDIIVFKYPVNPKRDFIKRLIGLPGETLEVKNNQVYIDGKVLEQSFLPKNLTYRSNFGPVKIPEKQYFMMGDNRNNSEDSRFWGNLPEKNIVGKAMFIYWPFDRAKQL